MPNTTHGALTKQYAPIDEWLDISGMGRTKVYEAIGQGHLRAVKLGKRTLIDVQAGLAWMANLPAAPIRSVKRAA